MLIKRLLLEGFRNYINEEIKFDNKINLFVGDNAQGKTNIIESIYVCSYAKTYRTQKDIDTINFDKDYYRITMEYEVDGENNKQEIFLDRRGRKQIKINDVKVTKISDIVANIPIVIFSPDDINIVKGSPQERRKFIDLICCSLSKSYLIHLQEYNKYLKIKNNMLKDDEKRDIEYIKILNENMSKHIVVISNFRKRVILELERKGKIIQGELTNKAEELKLEYVSDFIDKTEEEVLNNLNEHINIDLMRKSTVKGIQKDDILFYINDKDVEKYGSQGQARTVLLTMRLANFEILKEVKKTEPILLLDDIMSELDKNRVAYLFNYIKNYQSVITTTDVEGIKDFENIKVNKILAGSLK
ncbi:MAG: DNA replication/repair protein RecF [Clostridia bacterium]|nr:DNA replication/repair protein RecF [Clostridia bacterium]